jgi:hypothetical protein
VTNQGNGNGFTDTWKDRVIVSADQILGNGDDRIIGEYNHTGYLGVNESYSRNETILLPPAFTGRYNLYVQTDATGAVFENGLEVNNTVRKAEFFDVMGIPYADLTITSLGTVGTASSGQPLTVNWTVGNSGIGLTNTSSWTDTLYLAKDPQGKNLIAELGSFDRAGALAVGDRYTRTVQVTLPEGISGSHYLVAKTGGPFEFIYTDNNTLVSNAVDVTFTAPPDLTVTDIIAPTAVTSGNKIDLTWKVANQGVGKAEGNWKDQLYLQEVGKPNSQLINLASYTYEGKLDPGKSYIRQEKITIPSQLQGLYQVVVKTNTNNSLYEGSNNNNNQTVDNETIQISLPPRPDLQVQSITAPSKVSAGGTVAVEFDIINQGTAATNVPNWTDRIYLSLDNAISADDLILDTIDNGSALKPGESYKSLSKSLVIPQRFRGNAYLIVEADASKQVDELPQEHNNTQFKQIEVIFDNSGTGGSGQPSDLVTGSVVAPIQAFEGSTIEVRYKVTNKGIDKTDVDSW